MAYPPQFVDTPDGVTHDLFQIVEDQWWSICAVELSPDAPSYDTAEGRVRCDSCEALRAAEEHEEPAPRARKAKSTAKGSSSG